MVTIGATQDERMIFMSIWTNDPLAQYERQMVKCNHLILHEINDKHDIKIDMEELNKILEILHDYGILN